MAGNVTTTDLSVGGTGTTFDGVGAQVLGASGGTGALPGLDINKSGGGTLTIQDTIEIDGYNGSGWTYTAGTVDAATSTVVFATNTSVNSGSMSFNNVILDSSTGQDLTVTGTMDVDGDLTITTLRSVKSGTITVAGNLTSTQTGVGNNTGLITLDGANAQLIDIGTGDLPDGLLTINKSSGTASLGAAFSLNGSGQDLTLTAGIVDMAGFNLTIPDVLTLEAGTQICKNGGVLTYTTLVNNGGTISDSCGGPIVHWTLDEGSGQTAADSSGNSRDATLGSIAGTDGNDPSWVTCTIGGNALEFDGVDDYVEDPDGELYINGLTAFTASAWIKSDVTGTDRGFLHTIVPDGSDGVLGIRYDAAGSQSGFSNVIKIGLSVNGVNQLLESSANIQTTSWQHVAVTWSSGNQFALYLDGSLDTPGYNEPGRVGSLDNATTLFVGKGGKADLTGGWDGLIDQVRLYDRVLSAAEISALAATAPSGCATGPVGHWTFDEGSGQTAADSSANANDGTLGVAAGADASDPTWMCVTGGNALNFDGADDVVEVLDAPELVPTGDMTLAAWVKLDTLPSVMGEDAQFVHKKHSVAPWFSYQLQVEAASDKPKFLWRNSAGAQTIEWGSSALSTGTWYHVTGVRSGTALSLYVDGVDVGTTSPTTSGSILDSDDDLSLGAAWSGGGRLAGGVDDVRIYDRALSPAEIGALAASPPAACPMALVARYWMEEAASGQSPTQLIDDQVSPLDLSITYDGANPTYIAPSTGRGWSSATTTNNGRASILADGTKIQTALDGSTKASIELVVRVDAASSSGTRLIHIGSSTESGHFTVEASPTKIEFYLFGETIRGEWNPAWDATRMAFHLVYDSTQPTAADRVKLYKNGVLLSKTGGTDPPLNETISVPAGKSFVIGNREVGGRSLDGDITYAAVYDGALSASEISSQATALLANDDSGPAAAGTLYRSVGTNAADLNTSTRTVSVSGVTATFSGAMPANVGVGDVLQYQVAATWYAAFIHGRTSDTVYTVGNATGGTPQAAPALTAVNVYRAYTSQYKWETQDENDTLNDAVENFDTSKDLVSASTVMHVAAYADAPDTDSAQVSIGSDWVTGANNYIRIYTPVSTSEVGVSQRHTGVAGTGYVRRPTVAGPGSYQIFQIDSNYVRLEGLEFDGSALTGAENLYGITISVASGSTDIRIEHCLIHDLSNSNATPVSARYVRAIYSFNGYSQDLVKIANTAIYAISNINTNSGSSGNGISLKQDLGTSYVYNNTVFDISSPANTASGHGMRLGGGATHYVKNNYVGQLSCVTCTYTPTAFRLGETATINADNNVSFDASADDFTGANNVINQAAYASYFANVTAGNEDFHLLADSNALWGTYGADVDSDPNLPVTIDIDGDARSATQPDTGPDESVAPSLSELYRSVGTSAADLNTSAHTVDVAGVTATFSGSMPGNVGVGDVLQYQVAATWYVAFIHGRTSDTVYTVRGATGGMPQAAAASTPVSVHRAYTSLAKWESQDENDALNDAVENFDTSTDLVASNTVMHVGAYADGPDTDGNSMTIDGWITGAANYIRIYTPVSASEVGISQRHTGVAGTGFVRRPSGSTYAAIYIRDDHVRIEGLEIDGSNLVNGSNTQGILVQDPAAGSDIRISGNLIHDIRNSTFDDSASRTCSGINVFGSAGITMRVANNIVYGIENISAHTGSTIFGIDLTNGSNPGTFYVYNNTVYDVVNTGGTQTAYGIRVQGPGSYELRNNYVGNIANPGGATADYAERDAATIIASNNVSSDATADDFGGSNNILNQGVYATYFVNITSGSENLHLLADSNALWGVYGADLDSDPNLPVTVDIDGEARDGVQPDVGADEQLAAAAASATVSGTMLASATESHIVVGGKTLLITLTNDTWDATIGADNAATTALIDHRARLGRRRGRGLGRRGPGEPHVQRDGPDQRHGGHDHAPCAGRLRHHRGGDDHRDRAGCRRSGHEPNRCHPHLRRDSRDRRCHRHDHRVRDREPCRCRWQDARDHADERHLGRDDRGQQRRDDRADQRPRLEWRRGHRLGR